MTFARHKKNIFNDIKETLLSNFDIEVSDNYLTTDVHDDDRKYLVDIDVRQYEGEDGCGGIKEFYRIQIQVHVVVPIQPQNEVQYDFTIKGKQVLSAPSDYKDIPESVWEYFLENGVFRTFNVLDQNMIELIHRYPGQSDVYRFDINAITRNKEI